jgi:GAF domain-containing protein
MLRDVVVMRRERSALIREASDADDLRRSDSERHELLDRERHELLDRERAARAEAEIATARLETLQRITDAALARSGLDDQLPEMLRRIMPIFDAGAAIVLVPGQPVGTFAVRTAVGLNILPRASVRVRGGDAERAIQARRPMAILDLSAAELDALVGAPVQASLVAPLRAEGELVGLLYLACERGHTFTPDELGLLRLIAERVASAIDRAALLEAERRARAAAEAAEGRMRLLLQAGEALGEHTAVEGRLEQIARLAVPKLADFCAIDLLEADGSLRRMALAALDVDVERANWAVASRYRRDPLGTHPVWDVVRNARPVIWDEVDPDRLQRLARSSDHLRRLIERGICAWMGVPLLVGGQVRGAMSFTHAESRRRFAPEDLATAEELAGRVAAAIARSPGDTMG